MEREQAMQSARTSIGRGKCVILIACSGSKAAGGSSWADPPVRGLLDRVQPADRAALFTVRGRLTAMANAKPGPDVGGASTVGRYLPAFERYQGRVYKPVDHDLWPRQGDSCVVIVSALYGLLFPWEPIQDYDLIMTSPIGRRQRVCAIWRQASLGAVFARWAAEAGVQCVIELLSQNYRAALDDLADLRETGIKRVAFDYPGRFQASNRDRGDDLKELLTLKRSAGC